MLCMSYLMGVEGPEERPLTVRWPGWWCSCWFSLALFLQSHLMKASQTSMSSINSGSRNEFSLHWPHHYLHNWLIMLVLFQLSAIWLLSNLELLRSLQSWITAGKCQRPNLLLHKNADSLSWYRNRGFVSVVVFFFFPLERESNH